jgi:hypothetical protein
MLFIFNNINTLPLVPNFVSPTVIIIKSSYLILTTPAFLTYIRSITIFLISLTLTIVAPDLLNPFEVLIK